MILEKKKPIVRHCGEVVFDERAVKEKVKARQLASEIAELTSHMTTDLNVTGSIAFWKELRSRFFMQMSNITCFRCGEWPCECKDRITLVHGDMRDVVPFVQDCDVTFTDPPYGMSYKSGYTEKFETIVGDETFPKWCISIIKSKTKRSVFLFCRWDNLAESDFPKPKSVLTWIKGNHSAGDLSREFGRGTEIIAFWAMRDHRFVKRKADTFFCPRITSTNQHHPNEKPVSLIVDILKSVECSSVLDPFAGSGSTLVAAKRMGKSAIGIEISEEFCNVASRRLDDIKHFEVGHSIKQRTFLG